MKKIVFAVALLGMVTTQAGTGPQSAPEKVKLCGVCHGPTGFSLNPQWPNLAGQHTRYLIKEMQDYKKGVTRNVPMMTAVMATVTEEEIAELAEFYAQQKLPATPPGKENNEKQLLNNFPLLAKGEQLYRRGNFAKHIPACIACHGPQGLGNEQAGFPVLAGQHALYISQQLQGFKTQARRNDLNYIMRDISARMSEEEIEAVAYYIQGLR